MPEGFEFDVTMLEGWALEYGPKVLAALAILVIGRWAAKGVSAVIRRALNKSKIDKTLVSFISNIAYALMITFVVVAALSKLGINTTSIAAILAAAGLAVGLALQGSLSNFASGVMLIMFRPFRVGDYVEAAGTAGTVDDVNIFTTTLKTPDNKTVIVPNSGITAGNITNYSHEKTRRVDMVFGIGYGDNLAKAKKVLEDILAKDDRVLKDPEPTVAVLALADSSVNFAVRPWVKKEDYWAVYFDLNEAVKQRFDKEGISIPFPQRDVHIVSGGEGATSLKPAAAKKKKAA